MQIGFSSESRGTAWVTDDEPGESIREGYPDDLWEVEQTEAGTQWNGTAWVAMAPAEPTEQEVRAEGDRRVDMIIDSRTQAAVFGEGLSLMLTIGTNVSLWPADKQQELQEGLAALEATKAVRASQAAILAMSPVPSDFADDQYWP